MPESTSEDAGSIPASSTMTGCATIGGDAVVCAVVARARDLGLTIPPRDDDELAAARREGWIHVTDTKPARLLA